MRPKAALFCHNGLGDGINLLVLANNLHLNGYDVTTYQNLLGSMQNWFPHLPVQPYPPQEALPQILRAFDWYFVAWNDANEFAKQLIQEGKRRFPERLKVIYLYPSKHIVNERYYADCLTDPTVSIAQNMHTICEQVLHLPKSTKSAGLIIPAGLSYKLNSNRIVLHPTSGRKSKNWPKDKFIQLALHLKKEGYKPVFVPGLQESSDWDLPRQMDLEVAHFHSLDALAAFLYESAFLIGNDSGLGHLASALGIPTLTFIRRKALAKMWAPSFSTNIALTPSSLIPNIRGFRLRDRHWHRFITVNMARRGFERLRVLSP